MFSSLACDSVGCVVTHALYARLYALICSGSVSVLGVVGVDGVVGVVGVVGVDGVVGVVGVLMPPPAPHHANHTVGFVGATYGIIRSTFQVSVERDLRYDPVFTSHDKSNQKNPFSVHVWVIFVIVGLSVYNSALCPDVHPAKTMLPTTLHIVSVDGVYSIAGHTFWAQIYAPKPLKYAICSGVNLSKSRQLLSIEK